MLKLAYRVGMSLAHAVENAQQIAVKILAWVRMRVRFFFGISRAGMVGFLAAWALAGEGKEDRGIDYGFVLGYTLVAEQCAVRNADMHDLRAQVLAALTDEERSLLNRYQLTPDGAQIIRDAPKNIAALTPKALDDLCRFIRDEVTRTKDS